jgi:hypothetical protein
MEPRYTDLQSCAVDAGAPLVIVDVDEVLAQFMRGFGTFVERHGFELRVDRFALFQNLTLVPGNTYYCVVEATNGVGLTSMFVSDGVFVDATPPVCDAVPTVPGSGSPPALAVDALVKATQVSLASNGAQLAYSCSDPESGVVSIEVGLGFGAGDASVQPFARVALPSGGVMRGFSDLSAYVPWVSGRTLAWVVRSTNGAGLSSVTTSSLFRLDSTAPVATPSFVSTYGSAVVFGPVSGLPLAYSANASGVRVTMNFGENEANLTTVAVGLTFGKGKPSFSDLHPGGVTTSSNEGGGNELLLLVNITNPKFRSGTKIVFEIIPS